MTYTRYQYTCCDAADTVAAWHPGETRTLHWIAQGVETTDSGTPTLTLTIALAGPYADVGMLKSGAAAATTLHAGAMTARTDSAGSPVSVLTLAATLAPGYYNLTTTAASAGGSESGGAVIQVVAPGA